MRTNQETISTDVLEERNKCPLVIKHGDPEKLVQFPTPEEAFQHRTKRVGDCLFWTGSKGNNGYGRIKVNGKLQETHRFSWERTNGPIPEDMFIDHICHNPPCVNVEHLRLATFAQNSSHLGGAKKGSKSGIRNVYWVRGKWRVDRKSTRLNSSHVAISYAVFCLK